MALVAASCRKLLQQLAAWLLQAGQAGHLSEPQSLPLHSLALPAFGNSPSSACAEAANSAGEVLDGSVALRPGFKALGRVYTALADQQVASSHASCNASMLTCVY